MVVCASTTLVQASHHRQGPLELEEFGDPEAAPSLPATTLAAHATAVAARPAGLKRATTAEILKLAWPVMFSQGVINLAGLIDRAMIGRVGGAEMRGQGASSPWSFRPL